MQRQQVPNGVLARHYSDIDFVTSADWPFEVLQDTGEIFDNCRVSTTHIIHVESVIRFNIQATGWFFGTVTVAFGLAESGFSIV